MNTHHTNMLLKLIRSLIAMTSNDSYLHISQIRVTCVGAVTTSTKEFIYMHGEIPDYHVTIIVVSCLCV